MDTSRTPVRRTYLARRAADARVECLEQGQDVTPWRILTTANYILGRLGKESVDVFKRSDQVLQDFVNVQEDPKDILRFTKRYGVLRLDDVETVEPPDEKPIPRDRFLISCDQWLKRQNRFRDYWRAGRDRDKLAKQISEELGLDRTKGGVDLQVRPGTRGLELRLEAGDLWQALCLMLIGLADRLRVCQNESCPSSPFFIAIRRDQKFCDENCSRLVANRRWWKKHGDQWRQKRVAEVEKTAS